MEIENISQALPTFGCENTSCQNIPDMGLGSRMLTGFSYPDVDSPVIYFLPSLKRAAFFLRPCCHGDSHHSNAQPAALLCN